MANHLAEGNVSGNFRNYVITKIIMYENIINKVIK